jgi:hypothetical protein
VPIHQRSGAQCHLHGRRNALGGARVCDFGDGVVDGNVPDVKKEGETGRFESKKKYSKKINVITNKPPLTLWSV